MPISLDEARERIASETRPLAGATLPLADALGRLLLSPVAAPITQPPFPRSPLDGYALRAQDAQYASREAPKRLRVIARSFAGDGARLAVSEGEAVRIMTGAPIPNGADCVIRQEDTDCGEEIVSIFVSAAPYENYCFAGEDYREGELLARKGDRVSAGMCAVLAGAGVERVTVTPAARVAVLSTGSELIGAGAPLPYGKIYDSNAAYLSARLRELGVTAITARQVGDDPVALKEAFSEAIAAHDLVISTGGVSVGQADHVAETLRALGAAEHFHGVAVKPGMPAAFFTLHDTPVLALSGNPFAAAVTFELLARPCLARLVSDDALKPREETARLAESYEKPRPVCRFFGGTISGDAVSIPTAQQNGKTRMLAHADCLAMLPAGDAPLAAGTLVTVFRF